MDEDLQLALWVLYELHYRGFDGVDPDWEWDPQLLALRARLEAHFVDGLRAAVPAPPDAPVARALSTLANADTGPSMSRFLQRKATLAQFREFVVHRSIYHLKEADPHSWGIPRLGGRPKAALVEIQTDEYGGGRLERMHAELFRTTMGKLDLDQEYGAYLGQVSAPTLATNNLMSMFGLHRRWLPALLGHLAAFEMTSSIPNRRYGNGLRRLGGDADATRFYDEHVAADAVHEQIAAHDLCGGYVAQFPDHAGDLLFGAACGLFLDGVAAEWILGRWESGESSLRNAPSTDLAASA
ncbi:iron-containing redox enzyme family protein [Cryptosporangium japonicum]|uniref:Iron-containing redox enzyme family protein n=1 Tax=Cryptosporangium japonicum TaxID=80872 RepID=A0ABP3F070_9ACTN